MLFVRSSSSFPTFCRKRVAISRPRWHGSPQQTEEGNPEARVMTAPHSTNAPCRRSALQGPSQDATCAESRRCVGPPEGLWHQRQRQVFIRLCTTAAIPAPACRKGPLSVPQGELLFVLVPGTPWHVPPIGTPSETPEGVDARRGCPSEPVPRPPSSEKETNDSAQQFQQHPCLSHRVKNKKRLDGVLQNLSKQTTTTKTKITTSKYYM